MNADALATGRAELLERARAAHARGAWEEAESGYRSLLRTQPDDPDALHMLGLLRFQDGRLLEAHGYLNRSIERQPSALALANHASVLLALERRAEALERLDAALRMHPDHPRALLLRADLLAESGHNEQAIDTLDRIIASLPGQPPALVWTKRAAALHRIGRHREAIDACERALSLEPGSFDAHSLRGDALRAEQQWEAALVDYELALALQPASVAMAMARGETLARLGRLEPALGCFNDALAARPDSVEALYNSAVALERLGRLHEALARTERLLALEPRHLLGLAHRGNVLARLGRLDEAIASYDAAIDVSPRFVEALCNRSRVLRQSRRPEAALSSAERALKENDDFAPAWYARGQALQYLHRYDEALADLERAHQLAPDDLATRFQCANTLRMMMRHDEALEAYDRVLDADPGHIETHFSKAFVLLSLGDFARGWAEYEWRWREEQVGAFARDFPQPLWLGDAPLAGRTILLHAEQGLGDTLQFCRYVERVKALGATVVLEVQRPVVNLMSTVRGADVVVARGDPLPPFDCHCPLLSLALAFKTDEASIPADVPYLAAVPARIAHWHERLGTKTRPRIGIAWSGNPQHLDDHNRSIGLARLRPLLIEGVEWVSLQKVVRDEDRETLEESGIRHFGEELGDFGDTAALVGALDHVISVDTSVAHLAGALARQLWLLLPWLPDWRWRLSGAASMWYPSATLFRQPRAGDWDAVLEQVAAALRQQWLAHTTS
ncbi:tetratricopeptide repeat protein [Trinickia caryophylli]|uniref:Tetratricopeptide (TPR) repeat n=1 Tax=Trinickia caryophylli TaxID=28094 RepID=A0A1X7DPM0_TRICW|nr:tetratricopeptide repeat protein [Trinickia caryophylli]PMS10597.1 tetratricopeptide repeat protein [Trinickia caryophylli]TRX17229.1 tetratricopeptide repeat protein [Trinickia caryophylli]WQE12037.1 tetratricopeptide repeat protein [Trinickia caryophylli]SMF19044.1 Tetratricopeptide (TPR) repeat [Trinickia caryophylli]GLU31842.1 hypothetical protein Busp01_16840 [Trinickia caryophylli]